MSAKRQLSEAAEIVATVLISLGSLFMMTLFFLVPGLSDSRLPSERKGRPRFVSGGQKKNVLTR